MFCKRYIVEDNENRASDKESSDQDVHDSLGRRSSISIKSILKSLGPGIVTGAADDDPSGIATYSQAGAIFGLGMLWMSLFQYPLMTVIQQICARIGLITGDGLAAVIKRKYSNKIVMPLASLLLIANTINIGADIGAMGSAIKLIFPQIPFVLPTLFFTAFILLIQILVPYRRYVKILKFLTISLFAYVATAIIVGGDPYSLLKATLIPHIEFTPEFALMFVAMFGTTISPYCFSGKRQRKLRRK
jgi:NRAMP (natural resistance-associated macrophage protein)-like metal ion transporter